MPQTGWGWGSASLLAGQGWVGGLGPVSAVLPGLRQGWKDALFLLLPPLSFVEVVLS